MLLDTASKIISKEEGIEEKTCFSGGRGCADGSFCIRQALKKRREHGKEPWVLFAVLVKAFWPHTARRSLICARQVEER